jgi:uncharacterized repeat protein (TIGR03803 family)
VRRAGIVVVLVGVFGLSASGWAQTYSVLNVFKIAPGGAYTVLHSFGSADGGNPQGNLILDATGTLYGTTRTGGAFNLGTVFKMATDGTGYTLLHSFDGSDGAWPLDGLTLDGLTLDGSTLYGTASAGGPLAGGVVFRIELP